MRLKHRYRVFLVCVTGIFITVFDTSSSIVALPTIALEFDTDLPTTQWVIIGNSLTIAALLVPMGRLSDLIGRKKIYVVGCCLFAFGAVLASISDAIFTLIGSRIVVGVGSAMTQGTAMAILVGNFDIAERAKMLGFQLGGVGLGAIAGPAAGGLIVGTIGWRLLFIVTALCMVVIAISAQQVLKRRAKRPDAERPPFDLTGAVLFSSLLVAGLLTLTLGPRFGWTQSISLFGIALFVVLLAAFIATERRHAAPMLDFGLFRNGDFALGALGALVVFMGISSIRFLAPFFLQGIKGFDPSRVGLVLMPAAIVTAIAAPFTGRFADRFGIRLFANIGFVVVILGLVSFSMLKTSTPTWTVVVSLMVLSLGMSAFAASNTASILNSVDSSSHGLAASFVNLCRNTGNVIGIAFGTAVVTLTMATAGYPPSLAEVASAADQGVFLAFTRGIQIACIALIALAVPVVTILIAWSWRTRPSSRRRDLT